MSRRVALRRIAVTMSLLLLVGACQLTLDSNLDVSTKQDFRLHADGDVDPIHHATWGFNGTRLGELINPTDLALSRRGNLYVLDSGNLRVQVFTPQGEVTQAYDYNFGGGERTFRPDDLAVSEQDHVYLADAAGGTVFKFTDVSTAFVVTETTVNISGSGRLRRDDATIQGMANAPSIPAALGANWAGELVVASGEELWEFDGRGNFINLYTLTGGGGGEIVDLAVDYDRSIWGVTRDGTVLHLDFRGRLLDSFETPLREPMALDCDGGVLALADGFDSALYLYHESGRQLFVAEAVTPEGVVLLNPEGIALDYDNQRLYLANTGSHTIEVFDLEVWQPAEAVTP